MIDNDGPGNHSVPISNFVSITISITDSILMLDATFSISSPQPSVEIQVLEGDRIDNIRVQKSGNTVLSYNVSLMVMPLTASASMCNVIVYSNNIKVCYYY